MSDIFLGVSKIGSFVRGFGSVVSQGDSSAFGGEVVLWVAW